MPQVRVRSVNKSIDANRVRKFLKSLKQQGQDGESEHIAMFVLLLMLSRKELDTLDDVLQYKLLDFKFKLTFFDQFNINFIKVNSGKRDKKARAKSIKRIKKSAVSGRKNTLLRPLHLDMDLVHSIQKRIETHYEKGSNIGLEVLKSLVGQTPGRIDKHSLNEGLYTTS